MALPWHAVRRCGRSLGEVLSGLSNAEVDALVSREPRLVAEHTDWSRLGHNVALLREGPVVTGRHLSDHHIRHIARRAPGLILLCCNRIESKLRAYRAAGIPWGAESPLARHPHVLLRSVRHSLVPKLALLRRSAELDSATSQSILARSIPWLIEAPTSSVAMGVDTLRLHANRWGWSDAEVRRVLYRAPEVLRWDMDAAVGFWEARIGPDRVGGIVRQEPRILGERVDELSRRWKVLEGYAPEDLSPEQWVQGVVLSRPQLFAAEMFEALERRCEVLFGTDMTKNEVRRVVEQPDVVLQLSAGELAEKMRFLRRLGLGGTWVQRLLVSQNDSEEESGLPPLLTSIQHRWQPRLREFLGRGGSVHALEQHFTWMVTAGDMDFKDWVTTRKWIVSPRVYG